MKTYKLLYFLPLFFAFAFTNAYTQQTDSTGVLLQANPAKDRIRLRWLINNPIVWEKSLKSGFSIERYTIRRNGSVLPEREKKILTPSPISTAALEKWEILAKNNAYAAVIAQALYGEDFDVSGFGSGDIGAVFDKAELLKQRFAFALYAADMCFECACLAGWGYEDTDVLAGEYYLYRVIPTGLYEKGDTIPYGYAYTSIDEHFELPRPIDVIADFGDKSVQVMWNTSIYRNIFTAYQIEKSEDNVNFTALGMPRTPLDDKDYAIMQDSLSENNKLFYYRIKGLTIFGETSEPSDTVHGMGAEMMKANPVIVRTNTLETGGVELFWDIDSSAVHLVRSFDLLQAETDEGPYDTIIRNMLPETRSVVWDKLKPVNYFKITANSLTGTKTSSFPTIVMPIDSVPPLAPVGLTAKIDTSGIVHLEWSANREPDMKGYKVYRGNIEGEELISLVIDVVETPLFADSVDLFNLNTHVYYAVKALDTHYNQSEFSEILKVEKHSKVPPSAPVFCDFNSETDGITLRWIPSSDTGVAQHSLYRRQEGQNENKLLKIIPVSDSITSYKDTDTEGSKVYLYTITASSLWNVESKPSPEYRVSSLSKNPQKTVKDLKATADYEKKQILITWKPLEQGKIKKWKFYRSENETPLSLWKEIPAEENSIVDNFPINIGNKYNYLIIAVMKDGGNSSSEKLTINY
ncbi:MAG: hypothetical protein LBR13_06495 [Dysgonamonadaceae bacterium]|jgi:fibronectin type 3 domain-containing protein|nr:hypothetical protein [Dysgonamonadaceae bacterium]